MDKRARRLLILVLLVALGITGYLAWPREPEFEGQRLSEWLDEWIKVVGRTRFVGEDAYVSLKKHPRSAWPEAAVRAIGPKALPYLCEWLRSARKSQNLRDKLNALLDKQSLISFRLPARPDHAERGIAGFQILGPAATNALPELSKIFQDPDFCKPAAACLYAIGPAALPFLAQALTNSNVEVQFVAMAVIADLGLKSGPKAIPLLLRAITNAQPSVSAEAVVRLGNLGLAAQEVAPWLESMARDPKHPLAGAATRVLPDINESPAQFIPFLAQRLADTNHCHHAAFALSRIGPVAVPPLLVAITNRQPSIRKAALTALHPKLLINQPEDRARRERRLSGLSALYDYSFFRFNPVTETQVTAQRLASLDSPDPTIRARVVSILGTCGPWGALGLSRAAKDPDAEVRALAREILASLPFEIHDGAIVRGPRHKKQVALIFSGHLYAEGGECILEQLRRHDARASFFLTGTFLRNSWFSAFIESLCPEGHYLGPHSDKHMLERDRLTRTNLVTRQQFDNDVGHNLYRNRSLRRLAARHPSPRLTEYLLPPHQQRNLTLVEWANSLNHLVIGPTPGTKSHADVTSEAAPNFVSSQAIFDSIVAAEQQNPDGMNGFILLFHLGSGPARNDKFHPRFGALLDYLAAKDYKFVSLDELIEASGD